MGVGREMSVLVYVCGKWTHVNFTPRPAVDASDGCLIACPPVVSLRRTHPLGFKLRTRSLPLPHRPPFYALGFLPFLRPVAVTGVGVESSPPGPLHARRPLTSLHRERRRHLREQAAYYLIRGTSKHYKKFCHLRAAN